MEVPASLVNGLIVEVVLLLSVFSFLVSRIIVPLQIAPVKRQLRHTLTDLIVEVRFNISYFHQIYAHFYIVNIIACPITPDDSSVLTGGL